MAANVNEIRETLGKARNELLLHRNVVATGIGFKSTGGETTTELSIICSVEKKLPVTELSSEDLVPSQVEGVATDVVETGRIRAFQAPTEKFRPAPGGVSIGHYAITAGTLGCLVQRGGETFILSNNHVLANSNDASRGDVILQPGPYDGGNNPADQIATLEDFIPIQFTSPEPPSDCGFAGAVMAMLNAGASLLGSETRFRIVRATPVGNLVDAAIARPLNVADVKDEILGIGQIAGVTSAQLGASVQKSGRTTGYTQDIISQTDVTVNVQYGNQIAQFTDQLLAGPMSQGGDSGSAVLDNEKNLVGLLFAGSETTTIINRIEHVFDALNVSRS